MMPLVLVDSEVVNLSAAVEQVRARTRRLCQVRSTARKLLLLIAVIVNSYYY